MGNAAFAHPCGADNVNTKDALTLIYSATDGTNRCSVAKALTAGTRLGSERKFLQVHKEERAQRRILEAKEVTKAIALQAEELLRREIAEEEYILSSEDDEDDEEYDIDDDTVTSSTFSISMDTKRTLGSTSRTTITAATPQMTNVFRKERCRSKTMSSPPKVLGGILTETQQIQTLIKSVLSSSSKKALGKPYMGETEDVAISVLDYNHACINSLVWFEDDDKAKYIQKARQYMEVLHLCMPANCLKFRNRRISCQLSDSFVSLTGSKSSSNTRQQALSNKYMPSLSRVTSDSSSSKTSIGTGMDFGVAPSSSAVRLLVTNSVFMDLAVTGSFGLVDRRDSLLLSHLHGKPRCRQRGLKSPDEFLVLLNRRSGVPIAVGALKAHSSTSPLARIYATKRRTYKQTAVVNTRQIGLDWSDSLPLFTWAEFVSEGRYPNRVTYRIFMATGSDGRFEQEPSYHAVHDSISSREIRIKGRTERELIESGCAVLFMGKNDAAVRDEDAVFRLSVAKGVDPALFIFFAAFVDEVFEKYLQDQCLDVVE